MAQWQQFHDEQSEPYPSTNYAPPTLYVYEGGGGGGYEPNDAGLVMAWGDPVDGDYASAWQYAYPEDPDLTNCIITVSVTPPQMGPSGAITQVSLGLQNNPMVGGPTRAWYWDCGAPGSGKPLIWNQPNTIKIDTSKTGVTAATPVATSYMNVPGFNLKQVQWITCDENGNWVGGANPVPGPGGAAFLWNYWHWLTITPRTSAEKGIYTKWSQGPVVVDPNSDPPVIIGWDEPSDYIAPPMMADDWPCEDDRPVTDVHWWGSFIGWTQPHLPPVVPQAFHLGIWTNSADPDPCDPTTFSHPDQLVWQNFCTNWVWNFAGYDQDPRKYPDGAAPGEPGADEMMDACFQFTQLLSEDEWFFQDPGDDPCNPRIYWLSIAPLYTAADYTDPEFRAWGWKTRPHFFEDDAVQIWQVSPAWPPTVGSLFAQGMPVKWPPYPDPEGATWDLAFELTTNEPGKVNIADLNGDGWVDFHDYALFAERWLTDP
jgi:hypothetical protein